MLVQRWPAPTARAALARDLSIFVRRHPDDDRARLARAYLAWLYVDDGQLDLARATASPVISGPRGAAHDFAKVVLAAILVRERLPREALALLEPLVGKIVDSRERLIFGEQLVLALLGAKEYERFALAVVDWLAHTTPEYRDEIERATAELLSTLEAPPLERALSALQHDRAESPTRTPVRTWLLRALRDRLTRLAVSKSDASLARRLLDSGPPSLRATDQGRALNRVATQGAVSAKIVGRSVGLVLSLKDDASRRRSAEVTAGLSRALGLPGAAGDRTGVKLLLQEEQGGSGEMQRALSALAGQGAALLVAGVDDFGALDASSYAESEKIPVLLLAGVPANSAKFALAIGAADGTDRGSLDAAFAARGNARRAYVGPGGVPCESVVAAGEQRFPIPAWKKEGVEAILLLGDAGCARELIFELGQTRYRPALGFGFESVQALAASETPFPTLTVASGRFPTQGGSGASIGWYEVLGHDAALLARAALRDFPSERVDEPKAVSKLHARAQAALLAASVELWSTDRRGFEGKTALQRTVRVIAQGATLVGRP